MARPLRRVLIGLSIRLGIDIRLVEQWDMRTIREYVCELTKDSRDQPSQVLEANLMAAFGPRSGN